MASLPPTIKQGSFGDAVRQWQKIIAVKVDGTFGPMTKAATQGWQSHHKLVPDGIVGPLSWSTALGLPAPKPQPSENQSTDQWAYSVVQKIPNLTEAERQYLISVARGEGFYGKGWGVLPHAASDIKFIADHNLTGKEGVGSNNWGAVQGSGDAGSFPHLDHHADGTAYIGNYKRYSTPEAGAADMARILLKPNVKTFVNKGKLKDAVYAQHSNGYFELDPSKYYAGVLKNYNALTANLDWKKLLTMPFLLRILPFVGTILVGSLIGIYASKH